MDPFDRIPSGMRDMVLAHGTPDATDVPLFLGEDPNAPQVNVELELLRGIMRERIAEIRQSDRPIRWQDVTGPLPTGMGKSTDTSIK